MSLPGSDDGPRRALDADQLQAVFVAARARGGAERVAFLDAACAGDEVLRREIDELLAHDAMAGRFLADPIWRSLARTLLADLEPGDELGGYRLESFLGQGGTSRVFAAVEPGSGQRVALKVVSIAALGSRVRERFLREVGAAAVVHHSHLVEVIGSGEDSSRGLLYCVMRLVDGPTFAEVLDGFATRRRPPDAAERSRLVARFAELATGLSELHAHGLVHRDVKPANVVLDSGVARDPLAAPAVLVDFGLVADQAAQRSAVSTLWATFDYAAPEQLLGRDVGPAADVFGLGVTMHDLLAGRRPTSRARAPADGLEPLHELAPAIEPALAAIVAMATEPDPRWRYRDAAALRDDLCALRDGGPVRASQVSWQMRLLRFARRHPRKLASNVMRCGLGLAATALIVVVAEWAWSGFATGRATAAAFGRGDLVEVERWLREEGAVPPWFLTDEVAALVGAGPGDAALVHAFALGRRGEWQRAMSAAAAYLERDGLERHPVLARFVGRGLTADAGIDTLPLVAQLFHSRPDRSAEDVAASAGFRAALHARLDAAEAPRVAMDVMVALAGCGDPDSLERCARTSVEWVTRADEALGLECVRVGFESAAVLVRRSVALWPEAGEDVLGQEPMLFLAARRVLSRYGNRTTAVGDRMQESTTRLAIEFARVRRGRRSAVGLPDWLSVLGSRDGLWVRAAGADDGLARDVLRDAIVVHDPDSADAHMLGGRRVASDLGFLAGLLSDPACTERLRMRALAAGLERDALGTLFDERVDEGHRILDGDDLDRLPDEDSRLGRTLDVERRITRVEGVGLELPPHTVAAWDFCARPVAIAGGSLDVELCEADVRGDEYRDVSGFARLALPGVSYVAMEFDATPVPSGRLLLHFEVQKAVRAGLPMDGDAAIDVLLDGVEVAVGLALPASSTATFDLPLCRAMVPQHHRLTIRLSRLSTTTLRLYTVIVGS